MQFVRPIRAFNHPRCLTTARRSICSSVTRPLDQHHREAAPSDRSTSIATTKVETPPRIIFSGIQPTGVPHLGNYLGALRQWKDFQDEVAATPPHTPKPQLNYCIVDLHALTGSVTGPELARLRHETLASLLAIGLDPEHSNLFIQSDVPQHAGLLWILSTFASTGYLSRMTQWKSKLNLPSTADLTSDDATNTLKLGLFSYPVLQAADILLYRTTHVPVGEDQAQHIEFARTLARGFNERFSAFDNNNATPLVVPEAHIPPSSRIKSLRIPTQKMSKSHPDPKSRILITDLPDVIHAKLKNAVTDSHDNISYDPIHRPGISNLIDILKYTTRSEVSSEDLGVEMRNVSKKAFKGMVGDEVGKVLEGVRERWRELMSEKGKREVREVRDSGREVARQRAERTMKDVRGCVGLTDWEADG
jgi:tryptophanyl-tRNA synthetase